MTEEIKEDGWRVWWTCLGACPFYIGADPDLYNPAKGMTRDQATALAEKMNSDLKKLPE